MNAFSRLSAAALALKPPFFTCRVLSFTPLRLLPSTFSSSWLSVSPVSLHLPLLPPPEINSWLAPKRGSLPGLLKDPGSRADETAELEVLSRLPGKNRAEGVWLCRRELVEERAGLITGACVGLHADAGKTSNIPALPH